MSTVCQSGNLRRRDHCGELCIDGIIMLKWILKQPSKCTEDNLTVLVVTSVALSDWITVTKKLEGCRRKCTWYNLRYSSSTCLERQQSHIGSLAKIMNQASPRYKSEVLLLHSSYSVLYKNSSNLNK